MGDNQDDVYLERREGFVRQFAALPLAGTPDYWRQIETADAAAALPLEVLARCLRERYAAGAAADGACVYAAIMGRIQRNVEEWASRVASQARGDVRSQLKEDLAQECLLAVWDELKGGRPSFFLERFTHALMRLQQHVSHKIMEQAGEWVRKGVDKSTRISRKDIDSADATQPSDEVPIRDKLPDPASDQAFASAELSDLFALVQALPAEQRELIHDRFWRDQTLEELAASRHVTTRTIYNRLQAIFQQLGLRYAGGEEVQRGQSR